MDFRGWRIVLLIGLLVACAPAERTPSAASGARPLSVLATTPIVGDVVRQIGGEGVRVTVLMPVGVDPHTFEPSPQDVARVAEADVVFASGAGLEVFLETLLKNAGGKALHVDLSEGIPLRPFEGIAGHGHEHEGHGHKHGHEHGHGKEGEKSEHGHEHEGHGHKHGHKHGHHEHGEWDPHVWMDPINVITWTHTIEATLIRLDPERADLYRRNAEAYRAQLRELDAWIREQVAQIPPENRELVTEHQALAYFADRYGFKHVGTILPAATTAAQPSPQELAALEEAIRALGVKAVFTSSTVDPALAQRVAEDTGTRLVWLYVDSTGEPGSGADSYIGMMRVNVRRIVEALR
jgi:ABC-type Zn uptake system ZnuABC Zn-binding protein ZnuA